jgi:hypothetical protein
MLYNAMTVKIKLSKLLCFFRQPTSLLYMVNTRVSSKWKKKCFGSKFEPKQTETRSVSRLFRFVSWNQNKFFSVCFGVSNLYRNNRNKQNCFETNRNNQNLELLNGVWMWENRSETLKEYTYGYNTKKISQWRVKSSERAQKEYDVYERVFIRQAWCTDRPQPFCENYSKESKKSNLGRQNASNAELSCVTCLNLE